ncbi:phosphate/phosphite/phosphonate ABC transporter substrate-binding protein [Aestuariivirga sp.]|uniref:phosphate/phosphite/phosphonate ABC transporter substrate-binding protein n=1 Tax=Aestuariivirga sp. TaxID=2650926 RepID=UPI0039E53136
MIASLPMYDFPQVRDATDQWWTGIARHAGLSIALTREGDYAAPWRDPALVFSQTCGYPFTHEFRGRLKLVATPHYDCDGCDGPNYCSFIFAREKKPLDAFRGSRSALNGHDLMSGMLALKLVFAPLAEKGRFFASALETGGHRKSLVAVRDGAADVCAIDAVCVAMVKRYEPELLEGLQEISRSPHVPGLPYVTVAGDVTVLRNALSAALADPELAEARQRLFISGASILKPEDYDRILRLEEEMEKRGGLILS